MVAHLTTEDQWRSEDELARVISPMEPTERSAAFVGVQEHVADSMSGSLRPRERELLRQRLSSGIDDYVDVLGRPRPAGAEPLAWKPWWSVGRESGRRAGFENPALVAAGAARDRNTALVLVCAQRDRRPSGDSTVAGRCLCAHISAGGYSARTDGTGQPQPEAGRERSRGRGNRPDRAHGDRLLGLTGRGGGPRVAAGAGRCGENEQCAPANRPMRSFRELVAEETLACHYY